MSVLEAYEAAEDLELIDHAREGRSDALAELWSRHYDGTVRAARRWAANPYDAEDLASEAFSRMLAAVGEGGGPTGSVGGYLAISVRNLAANRAKRHESGNVRVADPEIYAAPQSTHANPVADRAELGLVREAFSTLPMRWRVVLWRTAVDRDTNQTLAQDMGMTANAVAALAVRARAGFRAAYLQAHVSRGAVDPMCQPFIVLLPPLVSGGRPSPSLTAHLADCVRCQDRAAELLEIERHLAALIFPAVLVAGWSQLGNLRPRSLQGHHAASGARPRAWMLAGAGSVAAASIAVAAIGGPSTAVPTPEVTRPVAAPIITPTTPDPTDPPPTTPEPVEPPVAEPAVVQPVRLVAAPTVLRTTDTPTPASVAVLPSPVTTPSEAPTPTETPSPTSTPTPTLMPAPTPTPSTQCHFNDNARPQWCEDKPYVPDSPSPSPTPEVSPSPSPDGSPSPSPTPEVSQSPSPDGSPSPSPTPEMSPSPSPATP